MKNMIIPVLLLFLVGFLIFKMSHKKSVPAPLQPGSITNVEGCSQGPRIVVHVNNGRNILAQWDGKVWQAKEAPDKDAHC